MSIIYVMIPLALALVGVAVWALVWAIRSGQFDELESHGWTPVLDDDRRPAPTDESDETAAPARGEDRAPGGHPGPDGKARLENGSPSSPPEG